MNTSSFTEPERETPPLDAVPDEDVNALSPGEQAAEDEYAEPEEEPAPEVDTEPRLHVPVLLVWGGLAVVSLLCGILFFLYLSQSSWDMGGNSQRVSLSACVLPWRNKLLDASAPSPVLDRLTMAAQPDIWKTEAYTYLREAQQLLLPLTDKPEIAAVLNELTAMLPDNVWGYLGCDYRQVSGSLVSPTLRPIP